MRQLFAWCAHNARRWVELLTDVWNQTGGRQGIGPEGPEVPEGACSLRPLVWPEASLPREEEKKTKVEEPPWGPVGARLLVGPGRWSRWKIAVANRWRFNAHRNVLELYAEAIEMS